MICVKCGKEADIRRDLRVSLKVIGSKTDAKKDVYGKNIFTTTETHQVQSYPFGFCNHCIRKKLFFSSDFLWAILCIIILGLITFGLTHSDEKKNQLVPILFIILLFGGSAVYFFYNFYRKIIRPNCNNNEQIVKWFVKEISMYCRNQYGININSIFHN